MRICPKCDARYTKSKDCYKCHVPIIEFYPKTCPKCQKGYDKDWSLCPECKVGLTTIPNKICPKCLIYYPPYTINFKTCSIPTIEYNEEIAELATTKEKERKSKHLKKALGFPIALIIPWVIMTILNLWEVFPIKFAGFHFFMFLPILIYIACRLDKLSVIKSISWFLWTTACVILFSNLIYFYNHDISYSREQYMGSSVIAYIIFQCSFYVTYKAMGIIERSVKLGNLVGG